MERTTITSEVVASPLFLCACRLASRFAPWALFEAGPFVSDRCLKGRILMELSGTTWNNNNFIFPAGRINTPPSAAPLGKLGTVEPR
jgi:hypothetical protein